MFVSMIVFAFFNISQLMLFDNKWIDRLFDIVLVFFILKTIALPILVLYKKYILLVPLFIGLLALIYGLISIVAEIAQMNRVICGFVFLVCIEILCFKIASTAKVN